MVKNPAEKILRESLAAGFPTTDGSESRSYHLNNRQPRKFPSKNNLTRRVQPSIQHGPVNAAEVGVEFKITVIEVRQARIFPEQPRLRCSSQNQHWSSCAVIVPPFAFSATRRPNSLNVITRKGTASGKYLGVIAIGVFTTRCTPRMAGQTCIISSSLM